MAVKLSPVLQESQFKNDGTLASGYKIITRVAGSSTPLATYTTEAGNVAHSNPIILNSRGKAPNEIWLTEGQSYDLVLTTDADVVVETYEKISGVNDIVALLDVGQWVSSGVQATYISSTSFSLVGDQTVNFEKGRAIKLLTSGGTVYAKILSSVYTTLTTVTIEQVTGNLDAGLTGTTPSYGLLTNTNNALPSIIDTKVQNQSSNSATTTGTSSALVFSPTPAYQTPVVARQAAKLKLHVALTGGAVTLQAAGQVALPFINQDGSNPQTPINFLADVETDGISWILKNHVSNKNKLESISASTTTNALTGTFNGGVLDFRSATLTTGTPVQVFVGSNSITIPSTSSLGITTATSGRLVLLEAYNGGTPVACFVNLAGGLQLDETNLISPTTIGAASNSDSVIYSASAVSANSPYRVVGFIDCVWTSGTGWSSPTKVQPAGGIASTLAAMGVEGDAPIFPARAWVNFNGTGTLAIRGSRNVLSVTDNGAGDYSVNFTTSMPDINYAVAMSAGLSTNGAANTPVLPTFSGSGTTPKTTSAVRVWCKQNGTQLDADFVDVVVFR